MGTFSSETAANRHNSGKFETLKRFANDLIWLLLHSWFSKFFPTRDEPRHDKTNKMSVRPAKTQISRGIRPVWSESSLCAHWVAKDPRFRHADSEDSYQTGRMPRLIWVSAGRTLILLVLSCRGSDTHGNIVYPLFRAKNCVMMIQNIVIYMYLLSVCDCQIL